MAHNVQTGSVFIWLRIKFLILKVDKIKDYLTSKQVDLYPVSSPVIKQEPALLPWPAITRSSWRRRGDKGVWWSLVQAA